MEETQDKKQINITSIALIALVVICFFAAFVVSFFVIFMKKAYETLPEPQELADIQPSLVSKVYASDGSLIHEFSVERRFWVPLDSIPDVLVNAVISIEDKRFYSHWGVDLIRILGAMAQNVVSREYDQGASTLTQQLVRNVYFTRKKTLSRKVREILTAIQVEKYYTKEEIIELYLNTIYLGSGSYGVSAAAQRYFSKNVWELNLNEAAVLAGVIQLPEYYRPDIEKNSERITVRRRSVLRGMQRAGFISQEEFETTDALEIPSNPFVSKTERASYFVEQIRKELEKKFGTNTLYNGGLSIYTTIDPLAQLAAEAAMQDHLVQLQKAQNRYFVDKAAAYKLIGVTRSEMMDNFSALYTANEDVFKNLPDSIKLRRLEASVLAMDVNTGAVRVMIGGRDFSKSRFNRALQGIRQPGSSFKPFVYAAAMTNGFTPASVVVDRPVTVIDEARGDTWRPENHDREFYGEMTIRAALRKSVNLIAVQVIQAVGPEKVVEVARKMGFKNRIYPVIALAMGTCEVTNLEMTRAYCAFANHGVMPEPYFVERVLDRNRKIIFENEVKTNQVIEPALAELMTSLMQDVVLRGTAASIRSEGGFLRPAAGKTGTTNNYTDAWFVGYTPQIACGVWVGTDRGMPMGLGITGSRGAIPIWTPTMKSLHRNLPEENFTFGSAGGLQRAEICPVSHGTANKYCPNPYAELFLSGRLPEECSVHTTQSKRDTSNVLDYFGTTPTQKNTGSGLMF